MNSVLAVAGLGYRYLCANDHLVFGRPWLDGPTALAAFVEAGARRVFVWPVGDEPRQLEVFRERVAALT